MLLAAASHTASSTFARTTSAPAASAPSRQAATCVANLSMAAPRTWSSPAFPNIATNASSAVCGGPLLMKQVGQSGGGGAGGRGTSCSFHTDVAQWWQITCPQPYARGAAGASGVTHPLHDEHLLAVAVSIVIVRNNSSNTGAVELLGTSTVKPIGRDQSRSVKL